MAETEIVLETHEDTWPERTVASLRSGMIRISHQYYKDDVWRTWQDMGASFPADKLQDLFKLTRKGCCAGVWAHSEGCVNRSGTVLAELENLYHDVLEQTEHFLKQLKSVHDTVADLRRQRDEARRERDLAVAHDRQPYPTAWAYEQVCRIKDKLKEEKRNLHNALMTARGLLETTILTLGPESSMGSPITAWLRGDTSHLHGLLGNEQRCPYYSRAYGVQCELPAGHEDVCVSRGDGFKPGYIPGKGEENEGGV